MPRKPDGNQQDLPVLAPGVSTHAQGLRLRRAVTRLAMNRRVPCCLPPSGQLGRAKRVISELNTWPACTLCPCHTRNVTVTGVGVGAERLARPFSYDSLIRYSRPVYPGAFPDPLSPLLSPLTPFLLSEPQKRTQIRPHAPSPSREVALVSSYRIRVLACLARPLVWKTMT